MDAHEMYYYSDMVSGWGSPPDTMLIKKEINNLQMWCAIFYRDTTNTGIAFPGDKYFSNFPHYTNVEEFYSWSESFYFEELYDINIPLEVFFGTIGDRPTTVVDDGNYLYYMVIDYIPPAEIKNVITAILLSILFIVGLHFFIRRYLYPVQLMKDRINALEDGDLKSKIKIIGQDELADLSRSMNQLISDINVLLENKHQLLLEVSHELRSPLARMQLLVAMIPEHKNIDKLKEEIDFLEVMISNLLLSDRLSLPYSKLDMKNYNTEDIINKVVDMFPSKKDRFDITNTVSDIKIIVDETKFVLAIRNLLDNAIKYSKKDEKIKFKILKNNDYIEFQIMDSGIGISDENIKKIVEPFYQANQTVSTKGFGLGLTICKKIIESHNGYLSIDSNENSGSTFILHLPINISK